MLSTAGSTSRLVHVGKRTVRKHQHSKFIVFIFLIGILSTQSTIGETLGYLLGATGYLIMFSFYIANNETKIAGNSPMLLATVILSIIFIIPIVRSPNASSLVRLVVFIPVFILNYFFVPANISREEFYGTLARLTAVATLVGFPALIVGTVGPIQANPVIARPKPLGFPIAVPVLMSIFTNQNTMGALAVFGALAALWEYFSFKKLLPLVLLFINSSGVYFTRGRAAALALLAGLTVVGIYHFTDRPTLIAVTVTGLITAPAAILIKFGLLPGPEFIRNVDFSYRVDIWTAAFRAMLERPLFGWGLGNVPEAMTPYITHSRVMGAGPHNSYIRMFAATGIIGGTLYLYIYLKSMSKRLLTVTDNADATEYGMVLGSIILHTFSGLSLFGLALVSAIPAIILGYAQKDD